MSAATVLVLGPVAPTVDYAQCMPIDVCVIAATIWQDAIAGTHAAIADEMLSAARATPTDKLLAPHNGLAAHANTRRAAWHVDALLRSRAIMDAKYALSSESHVAFAKLVEAEIVRAHAGHRKHLEAWISEATSRAGQSALDAALAK